METNQVTCQLTFFWGAAHRSLFVCRLACALDLNKNSLSSIVTLMPFRVLRIRRQQHNPVQLPCIVAGCPRWFRNPSGCTKHIRSQHGSHHHHYPTQPQPSELLPTGTAQVNNDATFNDAPMDVDPDVFHRPSLSPPQSLPNVARPDSSSRGTNATPSRSSTPINGNFSSRPPAPTLTPIDAVPISRQYHPLLNGNFFLLCVAYQQNNAPYRKRL
jgi:hypothetical protein